MVAKRYKDNMKILENIKKKSNFSEVKEYCENSENSQKEIALEMRGLIVGEDSKNYELIKTWLET